MIQRLNEIADEIVSCHDCALASYNKPKVPGWIPEGAVRSAIILDYPSIQEAHMSTPLVDAVGERVNPILKRNEIPREEIAILHCVKCSAPHERYPTHLEMMACSFIVEQINILRPDLMLLMGKMSVNLILGIDGFVKDIDSIVESNVIEVNRNRTILGSYGEPGNLVGIKITYSPHFKNKVHAGSPKTIAKKIEDDLEAFCVMHKNLMEIKDDIRNL